ncbi:MAG: thioesterase family protein [bacterium]|nr:MAG: thioesterase family protein [bacterium]
MRETLKPGHKHIFTVRVDEELTVPALLPRSPLFSAMPRVLATGYYVGLIEWACMEALEPFLEEGEGSVGTMINVTHTSPTLPGMEVTIEVACVDVQGRKTLWRVEARDDKDPIGSGTHERFTVRWDRFEKGLEEKAEK